MKTLFDCENGELVKVENFDNAMPFNIKKRLFQLGILTGTEIRFIQNSILKKVILIEVKKYMLCLRHDIAKWIGVENE